jgi:endonuclease YncB( thermonuclease family)
MSDRTPALTILASVRRRQRWARARRWLHAWWPAFALGVPLGIGGGLLAQDPQTVIDWVSPAAPVAAAEGSVTGRASVIDGDTIEIHGQRIRLDGIDAPESGQLCQDAAGKDYRCGQKAAKHLDGLIGWSTVSCAGTDHDRYQRLIARCQVGEVDLGAEMVRAGWALAYRRYSARYVGAEGEARAGGAGIWTGAFTPPWDWRAQHR